MSTGAAEFTGVAVIVEYWSRPAVSGATVQPTVMRRNSEVPDSYRPTLAETPVGGPGGCSGGVPVSR